MKKIVLKIQEGDLFRFFDSEDKESFTLGAKRTADICVHSVYMLPEEVRFIQKNDVWYVQDLTNSDSKSRPMMNGKPFRRPDVKMDGVLTVCRTDGKKGAELVRISAMRQIRRKKASDFDLTAKTVTTVGRGEKCDIRVDNPLVSEKHFFIVFDGANCFVEDAHSVGGTYVNNKKIKRQKLSDYDRISIPSAAYIFYRNRLLYSTASGGIRIDAVNVSKRVPDRNARGKISLVTNVSFRIEAGEFAAIVGGSGAGKSTLLDCINGMRPATDGKIYYDSNDYYENMNSYKGVIGYVPQKDILHDDLTVADALRYTARLRIRARLPKEEIAARVNAALEDVRLQGREKLRISSLSGGQKKRVSIAMELMADPKVIFLDEPTSGLSPDLDLEMMELLQELSKKGRTVVIVTHAMENLDKCDKVAFLGRGGRLCYFGESKDALRWFNRRTYSRIFASLSDEETSESFAKKYRGSEYYKKLYPLLTEEYGKGCALPPEEMPKRERRHSWEMPPEDLPDAAARGSAAGAAGAAAGTAQTEAADAPENAAAAEGAPEESAAPKRAARAKSAPRRKTARREGEET